MGCEGLVLFVGCPGSPIVVGTVAGVVCGLGTGAPGIGIGIIGDGCCCGDICTWIWPGICPGGRRGICGLGIGPPGMPIGMPMGGECCCRYCGSCGECCDGCCGGCIGPGGRCIGIGGICICPGGSGPEGWK